MENTAETPSPFVTSKQLNAFLLKSVIVAGKVLTSDDSTLTLDGGDGGKLSIVRASPSLVMVEPGMNVMVRGLVNQNLSIAESSTFPTTDLGDKFGMFALFAPLVVFTLLAFTVLPMSNLAFWFPNSSYSKTSNYSMRQLPSRLT